MNKRKVISIILKSLLIISCILGLLLVIFKVNGFMGGPVLLLYFTIQSNLWISITSIFGIIYN